MPYQDRVLQIEPLGTEFVPESERHGSPRGLFGVWFSANAEIATWMVGLFTVALYGTSLHSAIAGIIIGNLIGFGLLGVLSTFGPRYGVPQMVASRLAFGWYGNSIPAALSFLAGVGWFAINTVFGAYALQSVTGLNYFLSLLLMLVLQIVLAVYGYNMIAAFERIAAILLAAGFVALGYRDVFKSRFRRSIQHACTACSRGRAWRIHPSDGARFFVCNGVGAVRVGLLALSCDRHQPHTHLVVRVFRCVVPCIALQIMGAATVSATGNADLSNASPTQAIDVLLGSGILAKIVLLTVVLGTLTSNCMNLYSGALAALVVKFPSRAVLPPLVIAGIFAAVTAALLESAHAAPAAIILSAGAVALIVGVVARFSLPRPHAAIFVGIVGALLASGGGHPDETAKLYTNGLLLLSYWASPWAAVVFIDWILRRKAAYDASDAFAPAPAIRPGMLAWIGGLAASLPFWDQAWFTGPFAAKHPEFGDLSYYVGFLVAAAIMLLARKKQAAPTEVRI